MTVQVSTKKGDNFKAEFTITDANNSVNLNGCTARMMLRHTKSLSLILSISTETSEIIIADNTVEINIPASTMKSIEAGVYYADIEFTFANGDVQSSETFIVQILQDISY